MSERTKLGARLALVGYFVFMGTLFLVLPMSDWWPRAINSPQWLGLLFAHPITKGVVSGLGLVLLFAALIESHNVVRQ